MSVRVSVVVPTYRRPDLLNRCLAALVQQDLDPARYEIIVADDAACDQTRACVCRWAERAKPPIRYVPVVGRHGPAAARNAGWRAASGSIIAFTDDDCVPEPGWLSAGLAAFEDGVAGAWGRLIMPRTSPLTDYHRDAGHLADSQFVTANCFCRRGALEGIGGFDERFTAAWREDSDLFFTLLDRGHRVVEAPRAVVIHPLRPAGWGVSLKQQRKSMFNALLYKKHPRLYRERIQARPPWHYYASVAALGAAAAFGLLGHGLMALAALAVWLVLTGRFCLYRLKETSRSPGHVLEMAITSAIIPMLSVFWRLRGAMKFRVVFL